MSTDSWLKYALVVLWDIAREACMRTTALVILIKAQTVEARLNMASPHWELLCVCVHVRTVVWVSFSFLPKAVMLHNLHARNYPRVNTCSGKSGRGVCNTYTLFPHPPRAWVRGRPGAYECCTVVVHKLLVRLSWHNCKMVHWIAAHISWCCE